MKNILIGFILAVVFLGCSSKGADDSAIVPKIVVGKTFEQFTLNDQFEKPHTLQADTQKIVFAFSKDSAHTCNDFFKMQKSTYLPNNHTQFIADVSAAPSLIRSLFIMPGLKDFKHIVLLLEDKNVAAPYKKGLDINSIAVVYIVNSKIEKVEFVKTDKELKALIEK